VRDLYLPGERVPRGVAPMMRVVALLAVVVLATSASPSGFYPHHVVWRGTITTNGATGMLVARTHLRAGRDIDANYPGRFRCRGAGCPLHHGGIDFDCLEVDHIHEIFFGARKPLALYCTYLNNSAPAAFGIDGSYTCYTLVPPGPPPVRVVATGTMMLVPSRFPQQP
jgi:hypothetical protein